MIWFWVGLWIVLILFAALVLTLLGRSLWQKAKALFEELGEASDKLAAVMGPLEEAVEQRPDPDLAVFASPGQIRAQRYLDARGGRRSGGRHASPGGRSRNGGAGRNMAKA